MKLFFPQTGLSDTLTNTGDPFEKLSSTFDLFTYNLNKKNNILVRLSEDKYTRQVSANRNRKKQISYIGDQNGILNRYIARFDSSISYIDTTTHYRYFINSILLPIMTGIFLTSRLLNGSDALW